MGKILPSAVDDVKTQRAIDLVKNAVPDLDVIAGLRSLGSIALVDGVQKRVAHGLGRKYRGRVVVTQSAAAHILDDTGKSDTATYIYLTASGGSPTVTLLVF